MTKLRPHTKNDYAEPSKTKYTSTHLKALPIGSVFIFAIPHKIATVSRTSEKAYEKLIFISVEEMWIF